MLTNIKRIIINIYDNLFASECAASIGDIMLCRGIIENNQFLATTRLLDIEDWFNNKKDFKWQNTISYAAYGDQHQKESGNRAFESLISSYEKNGYDITSPFVVDKACLLLDGNHRMGMNLYHGFHEVSLKVLKRKGKNGYGLDWYVKKKIPKCFLDSVLERYQKIQNQLVEDGDTFCCIASNKAIVEALSYLCNIKAIHKYCEKNNRGGTERWFVQFTVEDPQYCVNRGTLLSYRSLEIEKILVNRFEREDIFVSKNCLEGYRMYRKHRDNFLM